MNFHLRLVKCAESAVERGDGPKEHVPLHALARDEQEASKFEVVNRITITGQNAG